MTTYPPAVEKMSDLSAEASMGRIIVKVKITNDYDKRAVAEGRMKPDEVRQVEVEGMVDTGATLVVLPASIARQLGLPVNRIAPVMYADGRTAEIEIAGGAYLEIMERFALVECLVEPSTERVLIGQIPLEVMDWYVDMKEQTLKPRPGWPHSPLIDAM